MTDKEKDPFSVVLSTYHKDDPDKLRIALESVFDQTCEPDEVVLVADGQLTPDLNGVLEEFTDKHPESLQIHRLPENRGRGEARRVAINKATNDIVAMMDADDVCRRDRFERQIIFFDEHPEVDLVGSYCREFKESHGYQAVRKVPVKHEDIVEMARHRNPINQVTAMFRREAVLAAGNYRDVQRMEDYGLWVRMLVNGARFANIPKPLVDVRAGTDMYGRRGGVTYAKEEWRLQWEFYELGFLTLLQLLVNIGTRVPFRFLPNIIRGEIYSRLFRSPLE